MGKNKRQSRHKSLSSHRTKSTRKPTGRKFSWIGGLLALMIGLFVFAFTSQKPAYTPEVSGEPRAQLDQTEIDYGDVKLNTTLTSVFKVRNISDQLLKILGEPQVELVEGC